MYQLKAIIQTNVRVQPVYFRFECTEDVERGDLYFSGPNQYTNIDEGVANNREVYWHKWDTPAFTPDKPLTLVLWSHGPIKVTRLQNQSPQRRGGQSNDRAQTVHDGPAPRNGNSRVPRGFAQKLNGP